jgi:hypothetical protein
LKHEIFLVSRAPTRARETKKIKIMTDTILWLLAAMQGAGAEHTVVLRGNAVNYAVAGQGAPGLSIGVWKQTLAPRMDNDIGVERVFQRRG